MDIHENHNIVVKSLHDCIELFNMMFGEICPVVYSATSSQSSLNSIEPTHYSNDVKISQYLLSPFQKEHIKYMSGLLSKAYHTGLETKYLIRSNVSQEIQDRIAFLENKVSEYEMNSAKDMKKVRALQEYLVNELNRNQSLEDRVTELESKLVNIEDEKRKYMKKVFSLTGMNAEKALAVDDLIGKYVMKKFEDDRFFGRIIGYKNPYFQVIYEDDDKEEMDMKEVEKFLWTGTIPTVKVTRITQYYVEYAKDNGLESNIEEIKGLNSYFGEGVIPEGSHVPADGDKVSSAEKRKRVYSIDSVIDSLPSKRLHQDMDMLESEGTTTSETNCSQDDITIPSIPGSSDR